MGSRFRQRTRSAAIVSFSLQLTPLACRFSLNVDRQVFFARTLFLLPSAGEFGGLFGLAFLGTTIGTGPFTDLDFADDVALLTELLSVLMLALETMNDEAKSLGLQVNWSKTKIQTTDATFPPDQDPNY